MSLAFAPDSKLFITQSNQPALAATEAAGGIKPRIRPLFRVDQSGTGGAVHWEIGMFVNQSSAYRLRNQFTLERLVEHLGHDDMISFGDGACSTSERRRKARCFCRFGARQSNLLGTPAHN